MKKQKVFLVILALAVTALAMAFGVLSQTYMQTKIATSLMFEVVGVRASISVEMEGAKNSANGNLTSSTDLGSVDGNGTVTKNIYTYSSGTSLQTNIPVWDVGNIFFHTSILTPIIFKVNVTNFTVGKSLEISIKEVDANGNLLAVSALNSFATREEISAIAQPASVNGANVLPSNMVQATLKYQIKTFNQASAQSPLKLKIDIKPSIINSIVATQMATPTGAINLPSSYNVPVDGVQTPYLLTWFLDESCTMPVEYNFTPISNQTLYGKTSKYPLFIPANYEQRKEPLYQGVPPDKVTPDKLEYFCIGNSDEVWISHINPRQNLPNYSIPPTITHNGKTFTIKGFASPAINGVHYCFPHTVLNQKTSPIEFPITLTQIGTYAFLYYDFSSMPHLSLLDFPNLTLISNNVFQSSLTLKSINLPPSLTIIGGDTFHGCKNLELLTINRTESLVALQSREVFNSASNLRIVVPTQALANQYKTFGNWVHYADRIFCA
ncbi:MAG: leucine-rich repeat protein [Clostridia bacterium]